MVEDASRYAYHPPAPANQNAPTPAQYDAHLERVFGKLKADLAKRRERRHQEPMSSALPSKD